MAIALGPSTQTPGGEIGGPKAPKGPRSPSAGATRRCLAGTGCFVSSFSTSQRRPSASRKVASMQLKPGSRNGAVGVNATKSRVAVA